MTAIPVAIIALPTVLINGEALKGLGSPLQGVFFGHFFPIFLFCLTVAIFGKSLSPSGLFIAWSSCFGVAMIFVRCCSRREISQFSFVIPPRAQIRRLCDEGRWVFSGSAFGAIGFSLLLFILQSSRTGAEVSQVTLAFRLSVLIVVLSATIHAVFAPRVSEAAELGNRKQLLRTYGTAIGFSLLALIFPISVGVCFPELVMSIFDTEFYDGALVLRLFLIYNFISLCLGPAFQLAIMTQKTKILPWTGLVKVALAVSVGFLLIPEFGGVGFVVAMAISFLLEEVFIVGFCFFTFSKRSSKA